MKYKESEIELTEEPVLLKAGTDGTAGPEGQYILFGDWPQTIKADDVKINKRKRYNVNGWNCYKGSDGCYYVKEFAKPVKDRKEDYFDPEELEGVDLSIKFSNGKRIVKGRRYYFKMESIKWRLLDNNYEGGKLLFSEKALMADTFYSGFFFEDYSGKERKINDEIIYGNNYEYSRIRAYLNGLNGKSYKVSDFTNKGFINKAFTEKAIKKILTVTVDNREDSLGSDKYDTFFTTKLLCNNTQDKIFLLSYKEINEEKYGFSDDGIIDLLRIRLTTDYARAKGAWVGHEEYLNNGFYWLRSPIYNDCDGIMGTDQFGKNFVRNCYSSEYSIVPALTLKP